jgi:hypothetical protein
MEVAITLLGPGQVALRISAQPVESIIEVHLVVADVKYTDERTDGKI